MAEREFIILSTGTHLYRVAQQFDPGMYHVVSMPLPLAEARDLLKHMQAHPPEVSFPIDEPSPSGPPPETSLGAPARNFDRAEFERLCGALGVAPPPLCPEHRGAAPSGEPAARDCCHACFRSVGEYHKRGCVYERRGTVTRAVVAPPPPAREDEP